MLHADESEGDEAELTRVGLDPELVDYVLSFDPSAVVEVHLDGQFDTAFHQLTDVHEVLLTVDHDGERSFIVIDNGPSGSDLTKAWVDILNNVVDVKLDERDVMVVHG